VSLKGAGIVGDKARSCLGGQQVLPGGGVTHPEDELLESGEVTLSLDRGLNLGWGWTEVVSAQKHQDSASRLELPLGISSSIGFRVSFGITCQATVGTAAMNDVLVS
jgi:hypothetical protein